MTFVYLATSWALCGNPHACLRCFSGKSQLGEGPGVSQHSRGSEGTSSECPFLGHHAQNKSDSHQGPPWSCSRPPLWPHRTPPCPSPLGHSDTGLPSFPLTCHTSEELHWCFSVLALLLWRQVAVIPCY